MFPSNQTTPRIVPALQVHQWLPVWDQVDYDADSNRTKPEPIFYLFSMPADKLKALTGIYRRNTDKGKLRSQDTSIQRRHDVGRSTEIREYVKFGFPYSDMTEAKRQSGDYGDLRKPGWLPTAIVVNLLKPGDQRNGVTISERDVIRVGPLNGSICNIELPELFTGRDWRPDTIHPIEVIDGQHRLWAFDHAENTDAYELPVVAFCGLDFSWQAYLFWTINIKPKRINPSLAFDLYPLLRTEDWLEKFHGHSIYRETRAQELTEALWVHEQSPWYQRINMLGDAGSKSVTQNAWIHSLLSTYIKPFETSRRSIGGLFGAPMPDKQGVLPWSRSQQAAFLIKVGKKVHEALGVADHAWIAQLRRATPPSLEDEEMHPAFYGPFTLLNSDQGIRALLYITNDLCYMRAAEMQLRNYSATELESEQEVIDDVQDSESHSLAEDLGSISRAILQLEEMEVSRFLENIATRLVGFDWRTSSTPGLSADEKQMKAAFRGNGGYRLLREQLLRHMAIGDDAVGTAARNAQHALGYANASQ